MRPLFSRRQNAESQPCSGSSGEYLPNFSNVRRRAALSFMSAGILSTTIAWPDSGNAAASEASPSQVTPKQVDADKGMGKGTTRMDQDALAILIAKDQIHELALLYSRGIDRKDYALLRSIFAKDGTADYGEFFRGSTKDLVDKWEVSMPQLYYTGHHVCNHLISVNGNEAEGEVYVAAFHVLTKPDGSMFELVGNSRYIDRYRKTDGRWYIAHRTEHNDLRTNLAIPTRTGPAPSPLQDPSVIELKHRLFARGARA